MVASGLNWTLIKYLQMRPKPIRVTRSRPYHKDDNAHVEQKNWMWPRQLLGYGRLEDQSLLGPFNVLYSEGWATAKLLSTFDEVGQEMA